MPQISFNDMFRNVIEYFKTIICMLHKSVFINALSFYVSNSKLGGKRLYASITYHPCDYRDQVIADPISVTECELFNHSRCRRTQRYVHALSFV